MYRKANDNFTVCEAKFQNECIRVLVEISPVMTQEKKNCASATPFFLKLMK